MNKKLLFAVIVAAALILSNSHPCVAGGDEVGTVQSAAQVLSEIMSIPEQSIPPSLLSDAYGIAIFPGLIKAGFILGARWGEGGYWS